MIDPTTHLPIKKVLKADPNMIIPKTLNPHTNPSPAYTLPDAYQNYDFNFVPGLDMNETRAENQDYLFAKGIGRLATGAIFEMAKVVPYLGGAIVSAGAALTGQDNPMSYMVDNAILRGIEDAQNTFNEDIMPIYQTNAAANGSLMDRMFEPTFWATQGADAGAFFLSMILPGRLAAMAGIGAKIQAGLTGIGKASRLLKPAFQMSEKAGKYMDDIAATLINTTSESAAEASHFYSDVKTQLIQQGYSEEEASQIAGANAASVFGMNMGILAASNFVFDALVFKSFNNVFGLGTKAAYKQLYDEAGQLINKPVSSNWFKRGALGIAPGVATEGFYEEGAQFATEEYYKRKALNLDREDNIWDTYWAEIADNADMHTGIFLGGILGGGASSVSTARAGIENKRNIEGVQYNEDSRRARIRRKLGLRPKTSHEGLRALAERNQVNLMRSIDDILLKDENGNIQWDPNAEGKQPLIDQDRLSLMSDEQKGMIYQLAELRAALLSGNKTAYDFNKTFLDFNSMMPYFQTPGGMETLKAHLEAKAQKEVESMMQQNPDLVIDAKTLSDELWVDAQAYKKAYDRINDTHRRNFRVTAEDKAKGELFSQLVFANKLTTALEEYAVDKSIKGLKEELKNYNENTADGASTIKHIEQQLERLAKEKEKVTAHGKKLYINKEVQKMFDKYMQNAKDHTDYTTNDVFEDPDGKLFRLIRKKSDPLGQQVTYHMQSMTNPNETRAVTDMTGYTHSGNTTTDMEAKIPIQEVSPEEAAQLAEELQALIEAGDPDAIGKFYSEKVAGTNFRLPDEQRKPLREFIDQKLESFETPQEMEAFADRLFNASTNAAERMHTQKMIDARKRAFKATRDREIGALTKLLDTKKTSLKEVNKTLLELNKEIEKLTKLLMIESTNLKVSLRSLSEKEEFAKVDKRSDPEYRAQKKAIKDKFETQIKITEARVADLITQREQYKTLNEQLKQEVSDVEKFKKWLEAQDKLLSMEGYLAKMRQEHHVLMTEQQQRLMELVGRRGPIEYRELFTKSGFEKVIEDYQKIIDEFDKNIEAVEKIQADARVEYDKIISTLDQLDKLFGPEQADEQAQIAEKRLRELETIMENVDTVIRDINKLDKSPAMKQIQKAREGIKATERIANFEQNIETMKNLMAQLQERNRVRRKQNKTKNNEPPLEFNPEQAEWSARRNYETLFSGLSGRHYMDDTTLNPVESQQRYFKFTQVNDVTQYHVQLVLADDYPGLISPEERKAIAEHPDEEVKNAPIIIAVVIDPNSGLPVDMNGNTMSKIHPKKSIYTVVAVPTSNMINTKTRVYKPDGISEQAHKTNIQAQIDYFKALRTQLIADIKANTVPTFAIAGKSRGIPVQDAEVINGKKEYHNKRFSDIGIDPLSTEVRIPTQDTTTIHGITISGLKGQVFVSDSVGNVHRAYIRKLNSDEQNTVVELFKLMANGATPQDLVPNTKVTIFDALNSMMYYGAHKDASTPMSDFVDSSGTRFLDIGGEAIPLKLNEDGTLFKEEQIRFVLKDRYPNVRSKIIHDNSTKGSYYTIAHNGSSFESIEVRGHGTGTVRDNYIHYLTNPDTPGLPILSTYAPVVSSTDVTQNQFKNQYLIVDYNTHGYAEKHGLVQPVVKKKLRPNEQVPVTQSEESRAVAEAAVNMLTSATGNRYKISNEPEAFYDTTEYKESPVIIFRMPQQNIVAAYVKVGQQNGSVVYRLYGWDSQSRSISAVKDAEGNFLQSTPEEIRDSLSTLTNVQYVHRTDEVVQQTPGSSNVDNDTIARLRAARAAMRGQEAPQQTPSETPPPPAPPAQEAPAEDNSELLARLRAARSKMRGNNTEAVEASTTQTPPPAPAPTSKEDQDKPSESTESAVEAAKRRRRGTGGKFRARMPDGTVETEKLPEVIAWFRRQFPNIPITVMDRLIENQAWGTFSNAGVKVFNMAGEGTVYHEAFHVVFNLYLSREERRNLIDKYKAANNINGSDIEIEEMLADDFMDYMLTGELSDIKIQEQRSFFRRLLDLLKAMFFGKTLTEQYNVASLGELFDVIKNKPFSSKPRYNYNGDTRYRLIEGLELTELNDALDYAQWNFFDRMMDESDGPSLMQTLLSGEQVINSDVLNRWIDFDSEGYDFISDTLALLDPDLRDEFPIEGVPDEVLDNALRIFTIVSNNRDTFKRLFFERMQKLDINLEVQEINEIEEESEVVGYSLDTQYDQLSIEVSGKKNATSILRKLLSTFSNVTLDGEVKPGPLGLPTNIDFGRIYAMLSNKLANLDTYEDMIARMIGYNPDLDSVNQQLKRRLNETEAVSEVAEDWITKMQFFQAFAKQRINYYLTIVRPDGSYSTIDSSEDYAAGKLLRTWEENAIRNGVFITTPEGERVFDQSKLLPLIDQFETTTVARTRKALAVRVMKAMGVELTQFLDEQGRPVGLEAMTSETLDTISQVSELVKRGFTSDTAGSKNFYTKGSNNYKNIRKLVELEIETANDFFENQHFNADNKTVYDISLNTYMSILTNKINRANSLDELLADLPFLGDTYLNNSILRQRLFPEKGRTPLRVSIHEGLKTDTGNISRMFKRLNKSEKFFMWFNDTLDGRYHMHRAADNALERVIEIDGPLFLNPLHNNDIAQDVLDAFTGYLADEIESSKTDYWGFFTDKTTKKAGEVPLFLFDFIRPGTVAYAQIASAYEQYINGDISTVLGLMKTPEIKAEIAEFMYSKIRESISLLEQHQLVTPLKDGTYINHSVNAAELGSKEKFTANEMFEIAARFTINDMAMGIEQTKWFTGHPAFYKNVAEFYKRMSALVGTKKLSDTSQNTNEFIKKLERTDEKHLVHEETPAIRVYVTNDVRGLTSSKQLFDLGYDSNYAEADAQGFISLDEYREFMFRVGDWTPKMEEIYLWETGHTNIPENTLFRTLVPNKEIDPSKFGKDGYVLPPLKPQYFGPMITGYDEFVPGMFKLSLLPLTKSLTKDRNLAKVAEQMRKHKVGVVMFASANKIGTKKRADGSSPNFYDEKGKVADFDPTVFQESRYDFWGIQVDNAAKRKMKSVLGSQQLKQHKSDLYEAGKPRADFNANKYVYDAENNKFIVAKNDSENVAQDLDTEFNELLAARIQIGSQLLKKRLGITPNGEIESYDKVVDSLINEAIARDLPQNIIDSLNIMKEESSFYVEASVASEKIENVIMAMSEAMTISQKRFGSAFVQASSAGFEVRDRMIVDGQVMSAHDLKFYRNEDGQVKSMQVYLPSIFKGKDGKFISHTVLNDAIAQGQLDVRLLEAVGFRIPTQGLSSIEHIEIKGFLPAHAGDIIIMPPEIVTKNGSDFDFDKLTTLLPNYYIDKNGIPQYVDYVSDESQFDALFERRKKSIIKDYNLRSGDLQLLFGQLDKYNNQIKQFVSEEAELIGQLKTGQALELGTVGGALAKAQAELKYVESEIDDFNAIIDSLTDEEAEELEADYDSRNITDERVDELTALVTLLEAKVEAVKDAKYVEALKKEVDTTINSIISKKNQATIIYNDINREIDEQVRSLFDSMSVAEKNGTEAIENRMNEVEKEIILAPSNWELLVAPLDGGDVKAEADYIKILLGEANEDTQLYSSILSPQYKIGVMDQFLNANAGVGISALQQTNHILAQRHGLFVNDSFVNNKGERIVTKINLQHNPTEDGKISLSHRENQDGKNIAQLLSQMTSAYVDAAKDPFVFYLNAGTETANVYMYLMRAGVPLRQLTLFMNQPIIKEFLADRAVYESIYYDQANSGEKAIRGRDAIVENTIKKYGKTMSKNPKYDNNTLELAITNRAELTKAQMADQVAYLEDFIRYMDTAKALSDAINATTYDTRGFGKNANSLAVQLKMTVEAARTNAIGNFESMFKDQSSYLAPYYQAAIEIFENDFKHYSLAFQHPSILQDMSEIIKTMMDVGKTRTQILKVLDRYRSELVTYLLHQNADINDTRMRELFYGDNSLPNQLIRLKYSMKYSLNPNKLVMDLEAIIPTNLEDNGDPKSHSIKMKSSSTTDTDEQNEYTAEWSRLFTTHPKFAMDLADFIIIQSGITNSPLNFIRYLPAEIFHDKINRAIEVFGTSEFYDKFFLNNFGDNDIVPHGTYNKAHAKVAPYHKFTKTIADPKDPNNHHKKKRTTTVKNARGSEVKPLSVEAFAENRQRKNYYDKAEPSGKVRTAGDLIFTLNQLNRTDSNIGVQTGATEYTEYEDVTPTLGVANSKYDYNPSNVSESVRNENKNYVLDKLGKPTFIRRMSDSTYRFRFQDSVIIETTSNGKSLSYPSMPEKIVDLSKQDPGYDIKLLIGLNKLAESSSEVIDTNNIEALVVFSDKMYFSEFKGPKIINPTVSEMLNFIGQNKSYKVIRDTTMSPERQASVQSIIDETKRQDCSGGVGGATPKAEFGMTFGTGNTKWSMITQFKGKSHKEGGIDIEVSSGGIKLSGKSGGLQARNGLFIEKTCCHG